MHDGNLTKLIAYSDSDWGRNIDSRRSITGYVFLLGLSTISWSSKKQVTVATLSVDGEYQAGSMTTRHGLWLRRLLIELSLDELETSPTAIFIDNRGARVLHGYGNTRGVSKTGNTGTGTVLNFGTPRTPRTHTAVSRVFTGIMYVIIVSLFMIILISIFFY